MSTAHLTQTVIEIIAIVAVIVALVYEPVIAEWEEKKKEKVLKAFKERRKFRGDNSNV